MPAANQSCLDALDEGLVIKVLERVPFESHASLRVVSKRIKIIVASPEFRKWRKSRGLAEYGLLIAGGHWYLPSQALHLRSSRHPILGEWKGIFAYSSMFTSGRWQAITPLMGLRHKACCAIVEDEDGQPEMWVMGGIDAYVCCTATVEAYNPRTNTWRSCLSMRQRRSGAVAGIVGGRLVVAGGVNDGGSLTTVEAYTPTGWTPLPPLPHAYYNATACVVNGRLYVMSEPFEWTFSSNKLQVLEMSEENVFFWTVKGELPTLLPPTDLSWPHNSNPSESIQTASAEVDGKLWLIGWRNRFTNARASRSVSIYDTKTDAWATGPALPFPTTNCVATILDGVLYVLATVRTILGLYRQDVYRLRADKWEVVTVNLAWPRRNSACASLCLG